MRYSAALILLLAGLLAACSSSSNNTNNAGSNGSSKSATTAATAAVTPARPAATPTPAAAVRPATPTPAAAVRPAVPTPASATGENSLASRLVLTSSDFPVSWSHTPYDASNDATAPCDVVVPGQTAKVHSDDFAPNDNIQISETVILSTSAAQAVASLDGVQASVDCAVKAINSGVLDDSTTRYSQASGSPQPFPAFGDASKAYRVRFHADGAGRNAGVSLDIYIDAIYVARGRGGFSITAFSVGSPYDSVQLQTIINRALAHLNQGLPATT